MQAASLPSPPSPSPLPCGVITGVFLRPPAATGSTIFERQPQAHGVPVALSVLGLEGSQEWHRLEKNVGKLSGADAADRALLMQVHWHCTFACQCTVTFSFAA